MKYWVYLLIFVLVLGTMLYTSLYNNVIRLVFRYLTNESVRFNYCSLSDIADCHVENVFDLIGHLFKNGLWQFDVQIIFGTRIFQIIIPFFSIVEGIRIYRQSQNIFKFQLYRNKNYKNFMILNILKNSFMNAFAIFCAYLVFYVLMLALTKGSLNTSVIQYFLTEILGEDFYLMHPYLYYLYDGFARFFVIPFIYAFFAQSMALSARSEKQVFVAPLLYFFGLSVIGASIYMINDMIGVYFSPLAIMTSDAYSGVNSYLLIFSNLVPVFIGFMIIQRKSNHVEI